MLYLTGIRVLVAPNGYHRIQKKKTMFKWTNEEVEKLPFNFLDSKEWRTYLKTFRLPNGKLLPRKTEHGELVVYAVYYVGTPNWLRDSNKEGGIKFLFPGYDKTGKKIPVWIYGRLDDEGIKETLKMIEKNPLLMKHMDKFLR